MPEVKISKAAIQEPSSAVIGRSWDSSIKSGNVGEVQEKHAPPANKLKVAIILNLH